MARGASRRSGIPDFTAAYFDQTGLYAFGRQAQAIHWDAAQLALSLTPLVPVEALAPILDRFPAIYERALAAAMLARLGVAPRGEEADIALADAMTRALRQCTVTIDRFFFDWRGGARRGPSPDDAAYDHPVFRPFVEAVAAYRAAATTDHPYWSDPAPCSMAIEEVEAIWAPIAETRRLVPLRDQGRRNPQNGRRAGFCARLDQSL